MLTTCLTCFLFTPTVEVPHDSLAEAPTDSDDSVRRGWTVGALVDTGYVFNSNRPDNHVYRGAVTTPRTGEATVNLGAAYLLHPATEAEPWHFTLSLQAGPAADALYSAEPVPGGEAGAFAGPEAWKHLGLASAGAMIPRTRTEFTVGLMSSPIGVGGFWSKDDWNVSPSWAANGTPYYLLGGRVAQPLPFGFGVEAWVVNGWQTAADVNDVPSYVAAVTWNRDAWSAAQVVMFGPEQELAIGPEYWQVHSDTKLLYDGEHFGAAAIWDVGRSRVLTPDSSGALVEQEAIWTGGGVFVRGRPWESDNAYLDLSARPDAWWDRDGRVYGTRGWLVGATGTATVGLWHHTLVRLEYRYDHATDPNGFFFQGTATEPGALGLAREQHNVLLSVVGTFERTFSTRKK